MRFWMMVLMVVASMTALAQKNVSFKGDKNLDALINKVENRDKEKKPVFTLTYEPKSDLEKEAVAAVTKYWQALIDEDMTTSYAMMSDVYRNAVKFKDYVKKDQMELYEVVVENLQFKGDCLLMTGTFKGNTGTPVGILRLFMRQYMFKENGEWHLYRNPYELGGITLPQGRDLKPPCAFPKPESTN